MKVLLVDDHPLILSALQTIIQTLDRCLKALPHLMAGEMDKATALIHTSKPPRPKPPRQAPKAEQAVQPTVGDTPPAGEVAGSTEP